MASPYRHQPEHNDLLSHLKNFDAFPKQREEAAEFFHRSVSGGIITICASVLMALLFLSELGMYLQVRTTNELTVDTSRGEQMQIHFDVTFPRMPCSWLSVDAMDVSGDVHLDVEHTVFKQRLSADGEPFVQHDPIKHDVGPVVKKVKAAGGNGGVTEEGEASECGSCYGADSEDHPCCETCNDVREAYRLKGWAISNLELIEQCKHEGYEEEIKAQVGEGCRMYGTMLINKVAGNIHFAPGRSYQQGAAHVHDLSPFVGHSFNISHKITKLAFGQEYPGMRNPLDMSSMTQSQMIKPELGNGGSVYQYFLKVVPTSYSTIGKSVIGSNQFSVTEHHKDPQPGSQQLPGVFFFYDLSPIKVTFQEERESFLAFLTSACAIVGGIFTVSGIVDAVIWSGQRAIRKKRMEGKLV